MGPTEPVKSESVSENKYNHVEAFCLMQYGCEHCGFNEELWNSRDGVTPFIINCPKCNGEMKHINWRSDRRLPGYIPKPGKRVFIDMPKEIKEFYIQLRIKRCWDVPLDYAMKNYYKNKEEAFKSLMEDFHEGEPYIITL